MKRYAFLCGSAPDEFQQKKIYSMFESLMDESGPAAGRWDVSLFANGINEFLLEYGLNNILDEKAGEAAEGILLYFCTQSPVADDEDCIWLCGNEIRKDVILHYERRARKLGIDFQVIFDSDRDFVSEESLGWEKAGELEGGSLVC